MKRVSLLCALLLASGAGAANVGRPVSLTVWPESFVLDGPRSGQQVLVTARYADGQLRDLTRSCDISADASLLDVQPGGYVVPRRDGTTTLTVRAGGQAARASVTVRDFARHRPVSFRREVIGALSVGGCNGIGCHGAPAGKNGFRLSLWGHDPDADFAQLTRDQLGRRAGPLGPDASLLLLKALGRVPHEGGRRFAPDSAPARALRGWLAEGLQDLDAPSVLTFLAMLRHPDDEVRRATALLMKDTGPQTTDPLLHRASVGGKYATLLRRLEVPQDVNTYSTFNDYGIADAIPEYHGHRDLPKGYWVYVAPHWYLWRDLVGPSSPAVDGAARQRALAGVRRLTVEPAVRVLHAPDSAQQLSARAAFADGTETDVTRLTAFVSTDSSVASVSATGLVEFKGRGEVAILCRYLGQLTTIRLAYLDPPSGFAWPNPPEVNHVDRHVFAKLKLLGIPPSGLCGDAEFVRRVYLDVCGILPTPAEARAFVADRAPDKRAKLIDALLARPEYADFWTHRWIDVLRVSRKSIGLAGARAYHGWLRQQVQADTPFDQVVRALLTSQGHSHKDGPVNFYCVVPAPMEVKDKNHVARDLAEATAQLFMGVRMQCAQCHDHPYERWTQDDYYGLAAFFTQLKRERVGAAYKKDRPDYRPLTVALDPKAPELSRPSGEAVRPRFPGGPPLTVPPDRDRRAVLAEWLTSKDNPFFARALANRLWWHLHGRGIVEPVDDFRDSNPSANDELLDALARDLVAGGFKVKPLLRTILNSRTYQLSARANDLNRSDERYFSHVVPRPLSAEVLLDALSTATGVPEKFEIFQDVVKGPPKQLADIPPGTRAVQLPVGDTVTLVSGEAGDEWVVFEQHPFLRKFGQPNRDLTCACGRETGFGRPQALEVLIGRVVTAKLRDPNNRLGKLLAAKRPDTEVLEELYLTALSRPPSPEAARPLLAHVAGATDRRQAWEDVLWTILRSQEFLYRH